MKAIFALWHALRSLGGNQRACIFTEPMWAIPYFLFLPFASVYMSALGLSDAEIGAVAALGLGAQFVWALLSGALVDKLGRRFSMLAFGLASWAIPCALWATARGFPAFAAAAILNGMWRVTGTSFSCLIVEDGDDDRLIHIFTILNIIGLTAGFMAPIAGLFMARFTLIPAMRALYALALLSMTAKFIIQYRLSAESATGRARAAACAGRPLLKLALEGWGAFTSALRGGRSKGAQGQSAGRRDDARDAAHSEDLSKGKRMRICCALALLFNCESALLTNFWPLFVTERYFVRPAMLSAFPFVKSAVTLMVFLLITPRVRLSHVRAPLLSGIGAKALSLALLLILLPAAQSAMWAVFLSAGCDAFALAMLGPYTESLMAVAIPQGERARVNAMLTALILLATAPIAWLGGLLSARSRALPLFMGLSLMAAEAAMALLLHAANRREQAL
jgi:hypothetical protein